METETAKQNLALFMLVRETFLINRFTPELSI